MKRHFGMEFKETEKGFTIEFSGDEETIKARKEAVLAWKEFVSKAKKIMPDAHHHFHGHHGPAGHPGHHGHHGGCCGHKAKQEEVKQEQGTPDEVKE